MIAHELLNLFVDALQLFDRTDNVVIVGAQKHAIYAQFDLIFVILRILLHIPNDEQMGQFSLKNHNSRLNLNRDRLLCVDRTEVHARV